MNKMKEMVDLFFSQSKSNSTIEVDTEKAIHNFQEVINQYSDSDLEKLLITAGYIPDFYSPDSSKETLYTKFCEVLEAIWAERMGYKSKILTVKSGTEDIDIFIHGKVIVSDTKAFRLSRSQSAPNVKDFVKPRDYTLWLEKFDQSERLGGLIVYPQLHEWEGKSHAYTYCSDKNEPIVMLPYHYLAYLLYAKNHHCFHTPNLTSLWNYSHIFPSQISSREEYWSKIDKELIQITNTTPNDFYNYMSKAEKLMYQYVVEELAFITQDKENVIKIIQDEINTLSDEEIREKFLEYRINSETHSHDLMISRIASKRLNKGYLHTGYFRYLKKKK